MGGNRCPNASCISSCRSEQTHMSAITEQMQGEVLIVGFTDNALRDAQRIEVVGREMQEIVPQAIHKKMLIDFSGLAFMSSAMINKLILLNKSCKAQGVALKFCNVSPLVMEVFRIVNLGKLIDIQGDQEVAVASFDKKGWFGGKK
ncbi:probable anti-anti-sigma regulatory factor (antagonist of anti-sigma factor) [Rhodopirellula baltica SH 1]|uniref:Probable anti-anti-sigma regulatory factor (Antagonist of anti-sigma factor) n=1 Tax=Rhodopirellula baltica (strain DSM 10527 / NCIMB 13988 / SH1) TaxID=243090 RepID=Q7UII6_RHOBA|nr:probable anti-anti-sigma regulatory factor (antagonist of anti-sigma factor) [Rhodopirellula baltica SH 1]